MENIQSQDLDTKLTAIDKALSQAKARKAMRDSTLRSEGGDTAQAGKKSGASSGDKAIKLAERLERQQKIVADRVERKAVKLKEKETVVKGPVYMKKIERAAGKLPQLGMESQLTFNEVVANFSREQVTALALHLQHFNRVKATERALDQKVVQGMDVRIVGGDPKFVGMTGSVIRSQRIRCYVAIPGVKREVYLFTSDVEAFSPLSASSLEGDSKDDASTESEVDILRVG